MQPTQFLEFLHRIERMKSITRHSWTADGTHETVAAHSFRLTVMAFLLADVFPELNMEKVLHMCIIHDFGEAVTGDIPSFLKTEQHEEDESDAIRQLISVLPGITVDKLTTLYAEMDTLQTPEARLYKALDKMEAVLQHNEADLSTWLPIEYELNRTYGVEEANEFPFLKEVRNLLLQDTIAKTKVETAGKED